jgi:hypothetical protein
MRFAYRLSVDLYALSTPPAPSTTSETETESQTQATQAASQVEMERKLAHAAELLSQHVSQGRVSRLSLGCAAERTRVGSRSSAAFKGSQEAGRVALNSRAAHLPLNGSLTSREFVNPSLPATTLKAVTPSAGESTAVNGRGGIAQGVDVEKSVGFSTIENFKGDGVAVPRRGSESLLDVSR